MAFLKLSSLFIDLVILSALCIFAINILESDAHGVLRQPPQVPQFEDEIDGTSVKEIRFYVDPYQNDPELEYVDFCEKQKVLRKHPEMIKKDCKRVNKSEYHDLDLRVLLSLFLIIMWGAFVRTFIRAYQLTIPYTVVLLFSGMIVGALSRFYCFSFHTFTTLGRLKPPIILYTFLPVLIFETAFGISSHVFFRACSQILVVALPGMLIATGFTAALCYIFFTAYQWTLLEAFFFGSIVSATDPVAVVAILKEVGVSESLSVVIDGESLLNDGVAIVLFDIFKELLMEAIPSEEGEAPDPKKDSLAVEVIKMLARIGLGGPAFGYFMAKIAILSLSRIFNDAVVEITITLAAAYLTYYIAEAVLHCSGVISVVILGITMSAERTCISPEVLEEVVEFWEMCAHLANTVLFFVTGIIISERGSRELEWSDLYYLVLLYFGLNLIRFIMLALLSPILSRTGYGLTWENMAVMAWGGLRGAVGICLSLEVYEEPKFCTAGNRLGPKVLLQTAGIVVLTLVVNGSTTKKLLDALKLTAVTQGRMEEMQVAVTHVLGQQKKAMVMLKHDRFLQDANWDYVRGFTELDNPYDSAVVLGPAKLKNTTSILSFQAALDGKYTKCQECQAKVLNEPSNEEYRVLTEEARLRIIKALKISYWSQFEKGLMTEDAVKILVSVADTLADRELHMIHCEDLRKYWTVRGIIPWIRARVVGSIGNPGIRDDLVDPPKQRWRRPFWVVACHPWFDPSITALVLLNLIPTTWEFVLDLNTPSTASGRCDKNNPVLRMAFYVIGWIYLVLYSLEYIIKRVGRGFSDYWTNKWNYLDFIVLLLMVADMGISFVPCDSSNSIRSQGMSNLLKGLRLFRVIRCIRLLKPLVPATIAYLNGRVNRQLFLGFDVIIGYITAIDDVLKYLRNMIENPRVLKKLKASLDKDHLDAVRETGSMAKEHPGIAIAVKTRHASRSVLNQMRTALKDLRMDGLLDDKENTLLTIQLEERMKRLWTSPDYIPPSSPEVLLENLIWVYGNSELKDTIFNAATLVTFNAGDVIAAEGEEFTGIYVIVTGMVKMVYNHNEADTEARSKFGVLPIKEIYKDFEFSKQEVDFLSSGTVIGEAAYLLKRNRSATVTCETDATTAYFIPKADLDNAFAKFNDPYDSFESQLWRAVGIRRGLAYLPTTPFFGTWSADKVRMHLERSCVPLIPFISWEVPSYVMDIILIEGHVQNYFTGEFYIAPTLIPRMCKRITFIENPYTPNRLLLLTEETLTTNPNNDEIAKCVLASYQYRRGFEDKTAEDDKEAGRSRFYKLIHFNIRQKKRRRSNFYSSDSQKNDAKRTNEATLRSVLDANTGSAKKFSSNVEVPPSENPPDTE